LLELTKKMPVQEIFNTSLNCGENLVEIEISFSPVGEPRVNLVGTCGRLDDDNMCDGGDYCLWKTRLKPKSIFDDGLGDGDPEFIDLDQDDL
jgi:hypothetical protein